MAQVNPDPPRGKHNSRLRRIAMSMLDTALMGATPAQWSYRCGLQGRLQVTSLQVSVSKDKHLPAPLRIAFASDFHAGRTTCPEIFATLIRQLLLLKPDVLLLGGDYVSHDSGHMDVLSDYLSQCTPPLGKYGVLGNHDLWADEGEITRHLVTAGVDVLVNRNCALPAPFDCVSIIGIDDAWTGSVDAAKAFAGARPLRILVSHSPDGLGPVAQESFDVGFAGHTHGGQIALRNGTPIISVGGPLSRIYSRGRFEITGNGPLIVSRGIGCSNLPIRINSDPELILCTLSPSSFQLSAARHLSRALTSQSMS